MPHHPVNMGSGWRCNKCGCCWDNDEEAPEVCNATEQEAAAPEQLPIHTHKKPAKRNRYPTKRYVFR